MTFDDLTLDSPILWLLAALAALAFVTLLHWTGKRPTVSLTVFYVLYTLQSTLIALGESIRGVFYPLYFIMAVAVVMVAIRLRGGAGLLPSGLATLFFGFYVAVLIGVMQMENEFTFFTAQRLFAYGAGILAMAIFWASPFDIMFRRTLILSSAALAVWVIDTASTTAFGYRGGLTVNPNYVAMLIGFGTIPLAVSFIRNPYGGSPKQWILRSAAIFLDVYALMLLASRGIAAGLLAAIAICILSTKRSFSHITTTLVVFALLGWALLALPGSSGLWDRASDQRDQSLNSRLPIWEAAITEIRDFTPIELLFGRGPGSSEVITSSTISSLSSLHNTYLQALFEYGLAGCGCFLGLHLICIGPLWRSRNEGGLEGLCLLAFLLTMNLSASNAENILYWITLGFAVSGSRSAQLNRKHQYSSQPVTAPPFVPVRARAY